MDATLTRSEERRNLPFLAGDMVPTPTGYQYHHNGRLYRLDGGHGPGAACIGMLEAWAPQLGYYVGFGDWSTAAMREEAARILSRGDADLEREIRRDLFAFRMAIVLLRIEANPEEEHEAQLLIEGLDIDGMRQVAKFARMLGGRALARRVP